MSGSANAKIYLADLRGLNQSISHRSFCTFNYGSYFENHREPFFDLITFNDETLSAGYSATYSSTETKLVLVVPLVGTIVCKTTGEIRSIDAGQLYYRIVERGASLVISNPFKDELVNYLLIEFKNSDGFENEILSDLAIEKAYDTLHKVSLSKSLDLYLGVYNGRAETHLTFSSQKKAFFVFVVEGVFEVNNRLLQKGDGLAVWDTDGLEFEALSNDAIILVIDMQQPGS